LCPWDNSVWLYAIVFARKSGLTGYFPEDKKLSLLSRLDGRGATDIIVG